MTIRAGSPIPAGISINTVATGAAIVGVAPQGSVAISSHTHIHHETLRVVPVSQVDLARALTDFVAPPCYERAGELLFDGVVVLCGPRHSGRWAAACSLLNEVRTNTSVTQGPPITIAELATSWRDAQIEALPRRRNHGFILDISDISEVLVSDVDRATRLPEDTRPVSSFGEQLIAFGRSLKEECGSYLVLVTTDETWLYCRESADSITVDWTAPAARTVAASYLEGSLGHPLRVAWLDGNPFQSWLESADLSPIEARHVAEAIASIEDESGGPAAAFDAATGWSGYLRRWFAAHEDTTERAFLIAAAALDHFPDREVARACELLLELCGEQAVIANPLRGHDISTQLEKVGAEIDLQNIIAISHRRPRLDVAVLNYVWKERPALRIHLSPWLVSLATNERTVPALGVRVANVMVILAARWGMERELGAVVMTLVHDIEPAKKHLALQIMDVAVLDPDIGTRLRSRLRRWCSSTDPEVLGFVAAVCGREFGRQRTGTALDRIVRVIQNPKATSGVLAAAGAALTSLTRAQKLPGVLDAVSTAITRDPTRGAQLFLELVTPGDRSALDAILTTAEANPAVSEWLADLWLATYRIVGAGECARVMCQWFTMERGGDSESVVLRICLPTLLAERATSLNSQVITVAPNHIKDQILDELAGTRRVSAGDR